MDASTLEPLELGDHETCVGDRCASHVDRCPDDPDKRSPGICGCGFSDADDDDGDGTPDCSDRCPQAADRTGDVVCGCAASAADADDDSAPSCVDTCPDDPNKVTPDVCGCDVSEADSDGDGMPDCADLCADDADKLEPGTRGCGVADIDGDGLLDCLGACDGIDDAAYVVVTTCGVGHCQASNTLSSCSAGVETACQPGSPLSATDTGCDDVDDDCDGSSDEEYVPIVSCGWAIARPTTCLRAVPPEALRPPVSPGRLSALVIPAATMRAMIAMEESTRSTCRLSAAGWGTAGPIARSRAAHPEVSRPPVSRVLR